MLPRCITSTWRQGELEQCPYLYIKKSCGVPFATLSSLKNRLAALSVQACKVAARQQLPHTGPHAEARTRLGITHNRRSSLCNCASFAIRHKCASGVQDTWLRHPFRKQTRHYH